MRGHPTIQRLILFASLCGAILASSGVVILLSTNQVSNTQASKIKTQAIYCPAGYPASVPTSTRARG